MKNQNESEDKKHNSFNVVLYCLIALMASSGLLFSILLINQPKEKPYATSAERQTSKETKESPNRKMEELLIKMNKQEYLADKMAHAPTGSKFDDLVKNEFGFWQDANGFVYEVEFRPGIEVISPLGKLSKEKQRALQKQKKEKESKIKFHKKELESLGVEMDEKENSNRSGFPVIDTGPVNAKVKQKMINEAKKQAEKAGK